MDPYQIIESLEQDNADLKEWLNRANVDYANLRKRMAAIELENTILRKMAGVPPDAKFAIE